MTEAFPRVPSMAAEGRDDARRTGASPARPPRRVRHPSHLSPFRCHQNIINCQAKEIIYSYGCVIYYYFWGGEGSTGLIPSITYNLRMKTFDLSISGFRFVCPHLGFFPLVYLKTSAAWTYPATSANTEGRPPRSPEHNTASGSASYRF